MPGNNQRQIYWDANVMLNYINEASDKHPTIEALLGEAEQGRFDIITSTLSVTSFTG
jgi:predicted nucleic acid-binding protein